MLFLLISTFFLSLSLSLFLVDRYYVPSHLQHAKFEVFFFNAFALRNFCSLLGSDHEEAFVFIGAT